MENKEKILRIKELREKTGLGMMKCRKTLEINNYNVEESIKYIRIMNISNLLVLVTYSENGLRIMREFGDLFDTKINSGKTGYRAALEIKEEYPELFKEYINLP